MARNAAKSHHGPHQTDPGIFAAREHYPAGTFNAPERHQQWSLGLTLGGRCRYQHAVGEFTLEANELTLARAGTEISWQVEGDASWDVVYTVFHPRPHWHEWLSAREFEGGLLHFRIEDDATLARVRHGLFGVHRIYSRSVLHRDAWALLALERVLLTLFTYLTQENAPTDPRIHLAVRFIHDHYARPLTNHEIARAAHSSVSHLSALFSQRMGVAPMKYLENLRLQRAAEMLRFTNLGIKEVLLAVGYRDTAYFSNRFKQHTGQSPRAFRQSFTGNLP